MDALKNTSKAFTLVELLVVISIISLLSSLVMASVKEARDKAEYAKALQFSAHLDRTLGAEAVGIWNFEEGSGTTATDVSGWNNHGTIHGATYSTDTYNDDVSGHALEFDGGDDYVSVPDSPSLRFDMNDFTVSLWVKGVPGQSNFRYLVIKTGSGGRYSVETYGDRWFFRIDDSSGHVVQASTYPNVFDNIKWHNLVLVVNRGDSEIIMYTDGNEKLIRSASILTSNISPSGSLNIGNNSYNGFIDDVRIYSTALTAQEIKTQYFTGVEKLYAHGQINEEEYNERLSMIQ